MNVFSNKRAEIRAEPKERETAEADYERAKQEGKQARTEGTGWSLRIPLTTAPRYACSDETASRGVQGHAVDGNRDSRHYRCVTLKGN